MTRRSTLSTVAYHTFLSSMTKLNENYWTKPLLRTARTQITLQSLEPSLNFRELLAHHTGTGISSRTHLHLQVG
jgi:hypothetical protein